jgi:nitroimidazol reductase NimA-like FMN-containing flavoprotein (pyridoxamine 5'-phosphate oxidase superfamily)
MTDDTDHVRDWAGLAVLGPDACYDRLRRAHVGRVGFVQDGEVLVLPVNLAVDGHSVVFRTGYGSKLSAAAMASAMCVEVDDWDDLSHTGWSVVARGFADHVLDEASIARFESLPVRPWASPEQRGQWVRVTVEEISGREILVGG